MKRPARVHRSACRRPFPNKIIKPEYAPHFETRQVVSSGMISWRDQDVFISRVFAGHRLGFEPTDDGIWTVHFYRFVIGKIDERQNSFI